MSNPLIYLVAGASRGIGLALVDNIATKDPTAIIYAGVRNTASASQLGELVGKHPGRVEVVEYVAGDRAGNDALAKIIKEKYGRVDIVIANAALNNFVGKIHETPAESFTDHFAINVLGPIILFQSTRELLKASPHPRFVPISSAGGSMELINPKTLDASPYGTSKAALNWVTRKIHFENEWLVAFPQCPGPVDTDMAKDVIAGDKTGAFGERIKDLWRPPKVAASMLVDIITKSTHEEDGGQFHSVEGKRHPW